MTNETMYYTRNTNCLDYPYTFKEYNAETNEYYLYNPRENSFGWYDGNYVVTKEDYEFMLSQQKKQLYDCSDLWA